MCLHPKYKDLSIGFKEIVTLCHNQLQQPPVENVIARNINTLKNTFKNKIRTLMLAAVNSAEDDGSESDEDSENEDDDSDDREHEHSPNFVTREQMLEDFGSSQDFITQFSEDFDRR